ncbi:MAG TPA: cupin domain-containing protein [Candidatus Paceibacterota bacterium]
MKKGYHAAIETLTTENDDFRRVLYTGEHLQLVLMSIAPGSEIGEETHSENDQFFRFESGVGIVLIGETKYEVKDGDVIIVPSGTRHNVMNASSTEALKLYTLYAPPHHKDQIVRATKEEAVANEAEFEGETTE